jgi:proline iminopeptidase
MKKNFKKFIKYALLPGILIFLLIILLPRTYDVPQLQTRAGTKFWDLPTGSRIGYTLIPGTGTKKPYPVIYLQGGPGGPIYDRNIKVLSPLADDGYDVYLYDQVGCGFSDRLKNIEDYTADRHKKDLEEIIKTIGAEKVILIGQSWGAILATLFIADNPGKVEKVIFTGPGPIYPINEELSKILPPDSLHLHNPASTNAEANKKAANIRTRFITYLAVAFGIKLASDKEMDDFQTYHDGLNKATVCDPSRAPKAEAGGGFYSQIMTMKSLNDVKDPRTLLKGAKIPVLIMKGQCDNQKWGYLTEYLELFPVHQLKIIPNAGHSISIEQPELYLETIHDFLNK